MKILITGASSGIGAQLAREYATKENELILLARREDRLKALEQELFSHVKKITLIVADVVEFENLQKKLLDLEECEDIDLLILNAGISLGHTKDKTPTLEEFRYLYDVNLFSNHAILEILLPKMQKRKKGTIVFISSLASLFSMPTSKVYSSSKRALNAYAEGIRYKYAKDNIKVLTILPGFIKSELTDKNKFKMPFLLETKEGALRIKRAIEKEKKFYPFPLRFYLIIQLFKVLPNFLREKILNSLLK